MSRMRTWLHAKTINSPQVSMVRNAHERLPGADMMKTCRLMSEEGVENPMGEAGIDTEATTVGMTWSGVMWRFVWPMAALVSNNRGHGRTNVIVTAL